jgi:uncharacterized membrane protein YeaQ/YmgE (transglycosylase-associated protein family)
LIIITRWHEHDRTGIGEFPALVAAVSKVLLAGTAMPDFNLSPTAQTLVNSLLLWLGFATVVAITVRSFMPFKEPSGLFGTLLIGVAGCCTGPLALTLFWKLGRETFNPISPLGIAAALISATAIMLGYQFFLLFVKRDK